MKRSTIKTYNCLYCGKENKYKGVQYANKYCNNICSSAHSTAMHKDNWYNNLLEKIERNTIRKYLSEDRGYNCECCGISEWNGKAITLQVDHIDGDAGNNVPDNVRLICPNCHSQQSNWGARNKGNGRAARGLPLR